MNVTYLLGNGFDINLGLETSYTNFYDYYLKQPHYTHTIEDLKEDIKNDIYQWSDLEIRLGEYTEKLSDTSEYKEIIEDITYNLQKFLTAKCENIPFNDKSIDKLIQCLIHPENYLLPYYQEYINSLKIPGILVDISIITFNYTYVLEQIDKGTIFTGNIIYDDKFAYRINPIQHIHGFVDQRMVIGVDNEEHVLNPNFKNDNKFLRRIVKPRMNDAYRLGHHKDCMQLINKTDLFILFGLSYGDTDKTWWNLIGEKLMNFKESILIVFHFDYNFKDTGHKGPDREDLEDSIKELISKKMGINDSDYKLIENRIIVAINTDIFKIPYPKSLLP